MKILFVERAKNDWQDLDLSIQKQLLKKLDSYLKSKQPFQFAERLRNSALGNFRFRIGAYRIIFDADMKNNTLIIFLVGHRKDIYR